MPRQQRLRRRSRTGKILLGTLACVYIVYLVGFGHFLYTSVLAPTAPIIDHQVDINSSALSQYWTASSMSSALNDDGQVDTTNDFTSTDLNAGKAAQQDGQAPADGSVDFPLSTVGKIFFSSGGMNYVCSGTAVASDNHSVVDTAGHCLYNNGWVQNLIFCPLYNNGVTPYGCWGARDLEVPSDWINAKPNDLHHDLGMAIVAANSQGLLTDIVGGAGWAYNQTAKQTFYAYGYPAGFPFNGQTRKSCEGQTGKDWNHAGGLVVSIPCNMTGGSSGGPWFIKVNGKWYLNGHNDFTSTIQRDHMFSPYYDDTWYALYQKAQQA